MAPLSAHSLLSVWAYGRGLHRVDQALALLAAADPGVPLDELAALSLGERDARLFALREETFGPTLTGLAACPQCRERLEFTFSTSDLRDQASAAPPATALAIETGGRRLRFRPLNSYDLAAISGYDAPELARSVLADRCLLDAKPTDLSPDVVSDLAAGLARCDPQAEVLLDVRCPDCGHAWRIVFDIASYLWIELAAETRRLLQQVDVLARTYGWREADILAMESARRQLYLEMAG